VLIEILAEGGDEGVNAVAGFLIDTDSLIANSKNNHLALLSINMTEDEHIHVINQWKRIILYSKLYYNYII